MALNPPISQGGVPLQVEGQLFVLQRNNMQIEVKVPTHQEFGKKTGYGTIYLTSCRIVYVDKDFSKNAFKSFDIPLALLQKQSFEQPVFGSNYLAGIVNPLYNLLPGPASFKLWFQSGGKAIIQNKLSLIEKLLQIIINFKGANTFLKLLQSLLNQIRKNSRQGPDPKFLEQIRSGQIGNQSALIDPDDPSVIYVTQPDNQFNNNNNNYIGNNIYQGMAPPPAPPPTNNYYQPPAPPSNSYGGAPPPNTYGAPPPPPPNYYVPPPNNYGPPPTPPPNNYNAPPPNNYNAPPSNSYNAPPPNNYNYPPSNYNYPPPSSDTAPPSNQYGSNTAPPPNPMVYSQPPPNNNIPVGQPVVQGNAPPPPPPQQPNQGYYFGFWGPQLEKNNRNN